jgi:hypothetical protein
MGQTTRHNRHLAERLSPRTMTGEGRLPNEETNYESRSNSCGWTGIPSRRPAAGAVLVGVKASGVGPWHRLVCD